MKLAPGLCTRLLFLTVPIAATSVIVSPAGYAATFARSQSITTLEQFTPSGFDSQVSVQPNTQTTTSGSGFVEADADALAQLTANNGSNSSISEASGTGVGYLGIATSQSRIIGRFSVNANQKFSFNFFSQLVLDIAIDNPQREEAAAFANIRYNLFDHTTGQLLDSFELFGELSSASEPDLPILSFDRRYVKPTSALIGFGSDGNQSTVLAQLAGTYSRTFKSSTALRLEETNENGAAVVAVPVPGLLPGLIISLISFCRLKRGQSRSAEPAAEYPVEALRSDRSP